MQPKLGTFCLFAFVCSALSEEEFSVGNSTAQSEYDRFLRCLEDSGKRCLLLSDQHSSGIYVYELDRNQNEKDPNQNQTNESNSPIWSFDFTSSRQISDEDRASFKAISDSKLIYKDYLLFCTSGGAIGLIEIKTKRLLKYWHIDGNLHSLDITPDGAIFAVASEQNFIVALPTIASSKGLGELSAIRKYSFPYGHAVVFDYQHNQVLWVGGNRTLSSFKYNYDNENPQLKLYRKFYVDDDQVHDLTPIPESHLIWLSTWNYIYLFNAKTGNVFRLYDIRNVKSISTELSADLGRTLLTVERHIDPINVQNIYEQGGLTGWKEKQFENLSVMLRKLKDRNLVADHDPVDLIDQTSYVQSPEDESIWWTDEVLSLKDHRPIFKKQGAAFYKGRYLQYNSFSYELFFPKKLDIY